MRAQVLAILIVGLMLSGCMTTQEFGNSLASAGVGANSGGIVIVGAALELIGNRMARPSKGTPEYEAKRFQLIGGEKIEMGLSLDLSHRIDDEMTTEQVHAIAKERCEKIDKAVAGAPLSMMVESFPFSDYYLPDTDGDEFIYPYPLEENPYGSNCLPYLTAAADRHLAFKQGKQLPPFPPDLLEYQKNRKLKKAAAAR